MFEPESIAKVGYANYQTQPKLANLPDLIPNYEFPAILLNDFGSEESFFKLNYIFFIRLLLERHKRLVITDTYLKMEVDSDTENQPGASAVMGKVLNI